MKVFKFFLFYAIIPFACAIPFGILSLFVPSNWPFMVGIPLVTLGVCFFFRKKLDLKAGFKVNLYVLLVLALAFTVMMVLAKGNTSGAIMLNFCWLITPIFPVMLLPILMDAAEAIFITAFATYLVAFIFCAVMTKPNIKKLLIPAFCVVLCFLVSGHFYCNRPTAKYAGHGFDYMSGYSSTDFTDYTVYAENSKLVTLDHEASLIIENEEDMPVLDGAEACYPLYAAFAKAAYKDIDKIELAAKDNGNYLNGKIVSFSNTIYGFYRLIYGEKDPEKYMSRVDMLFGSMPSESQMEEAKEAGYELEITPVGREGFVFFVESDNPVDGLTSDEIRAIYHGDITNWKEVGGKNQEIVAFQRPSNSGSQTRMERFMSDMTLKEPKTYEMISAMEGVITKVAQYANEEGAMGYTFRYFLEELQQEKGVKMLAVDGVYPSVENIENGSYPLTGQLVLVTRKDDPNPYVQKMKEFILSEDGQYLIRETGYAPLKEE